MRRPDERNTKQERDQKEIKEKNSLFPFWPFCCSSFVSRFCLIRYTDRYNPSSRRCFYPIVKKSASRNMRMKLKWKQRKKESPLIHFQTDWLDDQHASLGTSRPLLIRRPAPPFFHLDSFEIRSFSLKSPSHSLCSLSSVSPYSLLFSVSLSSQWWPTKKSGLISQLKRNKMWVVDRPIGRTNEK